MSVRLALLGLVPRVLPDLLRAYAEFTSKSDSPQVFHLWIALGTVAGAAQRKVFGHTLYFDVHTNLYVILTSPPGRSKKGAALRVGKNFLKRVTPPVNFATESASPEGLVKLFTKINNPAHQSMSLYSMELGTLMSTRPGEMVDMLTDIYDGNPDWDRQTVAHDKQAITRPWLNLMAGTTPKWLGDKLGLIALEGGLVARCIFPYSEERLLNNPWPKQTTEFDTLGAAIVNDLCHIATLEGEFDFDGGETGDAYGWYDAWYRNEGGRFPKFDDPRTASYYDRKHIHLLKVAMALSLTYKDELLWTLQDLQRALRLLDTTEPGMHKALGAAGKNILAVETLRIGQHIRSKGSATYKEIFIATFHDLPEGKKSLDRALDELQTMGRVKKNGNMIYEWIGGE